MDQSGGRHELEAAAADPATAMESIALQAEFLTDAARAAVAWLEGDEMAYQAATGIAAKSLGVRLRNQASLSSWCVRTGEVLRCDDSDKDNQVDKAACSWVGLRSMIVVPLVHEGRGCTGPGLR